MELVLGDRGFTLLRADGKPVVDDRPAADYAEISGVDISGHRLTIHFSTPGSSWEFAAADAYGATWGCEFLEAQQRRAQAAKTAEQATSVEAVAGRLADLFVHTGPQIASGTEYLLRSAVVLGATDLHVVPGYTQAILRLRVDGSLRTVLTLHPGVAAALVSRFKAMAGLPSYVTDEPQYGRLSVTVHERRVDLRLTTSPAVGGEAAVVRILDGGEPALVLDNLGLERGQQEQLLAAVARPGLAVFTGPAGAGKTTTMYALLEALLAAAHDRSGVTVEQPPERWLEGVTQIDVGELGGAWDQALQAALRLDPDLLLLGEVRDSCTALVAAHASLAGHTLLTTMHAGEAAVVPVRLVQLGVPPAAAASALQVIVAQRLLRRVCPACSEPDSYAGEALAQLTGIAHDTDTAGFARGQGCPQCLGTGLRGRTGVFEVWPVSERLRELVIQGAPASAFAPLHAEEQTLGLREAALTKARRGEVPLTEIMRAFAPLGGATGAES